MGESYTRPWPLRPARAWKRRSVSLQPTQQDTGGHCAAIATARGPGVNPVATFEARRALGALTYNLRISA
ncbi:MAG: hypothetical protein HOO08_09745 [Opitutae bacterium]|nr:hypothetical protein [Opitutae bacterium]